MRLFTCLILMWSTASFAAPPPPTLETRTWGDVLPERMALGALDVDLPTEGPVVVRLSEPADRPAPPPSIPNTPYQEISGGTFLTSPGEPLVEYLSTLPLRRRALGPAGVEVNVLYGEDLLGTGLCQNPQLRVPLSQDGEDWEALLELPSRMGLLGEPEPILVELGDACIAALNELPYEEAIRSSVCGGVEDIFMVEGGSCRACLEGGDSWDTCESLDQCDERTTYRIRTDYGDGEHTYLVSRTQAVACAPDFAVDAWVLYFPDEDDPDNVAPPEPWDHERWASVCTPAWDARKNDTTYFCAINNTEVGGAVGEGMPGKTLYMRRDGERNRNHEGRLYWSPRIWTAPGRAITHFWAYDGSLGSVSIPLFIDDLNGNGIEDEEDLDSARGGWDLNPTELRLDATGTSFDDTKWRDYLGAIAMKTATTRKGIIVNVYNHNRCKPDAWEDIGGGRYRCRDLNPRNIRWKDDATTTWWRGDKEVQFAFAASTLASTGLPDETLPGGFIVDMRGSTTLAGPHWENCAWPQTFTPDLTPFYKDPSDPGLGIGGLWGQTWRFDRPESDAPDIRIVMATNLVRNYCPVEETR